MNRPVVEQVIDWQQIDHCVRPTYRGLSFNSRPAALRQLLLVERIVRDHPRPDTVIGLDVGSKYRDLRYLLGTYDINCLRLDICERDDTDGFIVGNARALPFEDSSLDFLVTSHVLAHIDVLEEFLDEAFRVLKPDGRLYILQNNCLGWWKFWGYFLVRNDRKAHYRAFDWWSIQRWLANSQLAIERVTSPYYFYLHGKWSDSCYRFDRLHGHKQPRWLATQWLISSIKAAPGTRTRRSTGRPPALLTILAYFFAGAHSFVIKTLELLARYEHHRRLMHR